MTPTIVSFVAVFFGAALGYCCAQLIWAIVERALRRKREKEWHEWAQTQIKALRKRGESRD